MSKEIASNFPGLQWDPKKKRYQAKSHGKRFRSKDPQKAYAALLSFRDKVKTNREENIKSILEQDPSFKPVKGFEWAYMISDKGNVLCTSEYNWRVMDFTATAKGPVVKMQTGPKGVSRTKPVLDLLDNPTQDTMDYLMKWKKDILPREKKVHDHELQAAKCEGLKYVRWSRNKNTFTAERVFLGKEVRASSVKSPQKALEGMQEKINAIREANLGTGWITCKRFPQLQVNAQGQVRDFNTLKRVWGRTTPEGYRRLFSKVGVHNLVAEAFLGERSHPDGRRYVVDHINGNRSDNSVGNLQVISHRLNRMKGTEEFLNGTHNISPNNTLRIKDHISQRFDTLEEAQAMRTKIELSMDDYFLSY